MLRLTFISLLPLALSFNPFYWIHPTHSGSPFQSLPVSKPVEPIRPLPYYDNFSPRFGKFFFKPFSFSKTRPTTRKPEVDKKKDREAVCAASGGTLVVKECLEFFEKEVSYDDARAKCLTKNGDLYVPTKFEGFLFAKFFLYFPKAFNVNNGMTLGWVGARREAPGRPILTVDGNDVTMDAIYNLRPVTNPACVHISVDDHVLTGDDCYVKKPFTCEYDMPHDDDEDDDYDGNDDNDDRNDNKLPYATTTTAPFSFYNRLSSYY